MAGWRLLFDLDSCDDRLYRQLTRLDWDCFLPNTGAFDEWEDEEILRLAVSQERVVYTCNKVHFARLHATWAKAGEPHWGIIIRQPQKASPEQQLRALLAVHEVHGEDITNQLVWATAR